MNEYRSSVVFATPGLPLRDDVRRLGTLVGDLISEQVSPGFLDEVEDVRTAAIARRESQAPLLSLSTQLAGRSPRDAEALVRKIIDANLGRRQPTRAQPGSAALALHR